MPIIVGMFGPVISASSSPTRAPSFAMATARFAATVDLPTPPLLLAMAMMLRTPSTACGPAVRCCATFASIVTLACVTPGRAMIAAWASACICSRTGHAGVVSTMLTDTAPSQMFGVCTKPSETMSRCRSGSSMLRSAFSTSCSLMLMLCSSIEL